MSNTTYSLLGKGLKLNTESDIQPYCDEISKFENLEIIVLSGNTLGVDACKALGEALKTKTTLKVLTLSDIFTGRLREEIPPSLTYICDAVMDHPHLVELDLSDNAFGPAGAEPLVPFLSYHTQLETLKLNNNGLGVAGGTFIAKALIAAGEKNEKEGKKSNLKTIITGRNRLENGSSELLAKAFELHKESLETVRMPQNGIRPEGVANLVRGLSKCSNLKHLDLQDNTFTVSGSKALAESVTNWTNLQHLNIGDCMLEPKGGLAVAKALLASPPKKLETLQLQYGELRADSAQVILQLVPHLPELKSLELNGNQFPEDADVVDQIKEALAEEDILGSLSDMEELSDEEEEEEEEDEDVDELAEDLAKVKI